MIRAALFVALFALAAAASLSFDSQWESFKTKYGKYYASTAEETFRRNVFAQKLEEIKAHNRRADNGEVTYRKGINKFSDLTAEEFKAKYLGFKPTARQSTSFIHKVNYTVKVPASVDWRTKGIVSEVKNQQECGSCWAFSAIAAIESANAQKTGKLVELSEQNVLDCSWNYNGTGCDGGKMDYAFSYVIDNKGIDTEKSYPYISGHGKDYHTCRYTEANKGGSISSFVDIPEADENGLLSAVAERVVSVAIDAMKLQSYESGIYTGECYSWYQTLNHGVAVVGYGSENGTPYWIVKNSWGTDFGESGYFRLYRGSNWCGVAEAASYPIV
ncbi:cathepsin L1-like [Tetranychus urticae]|uniref:cathepsin L1-like n=1 Tax=Tetranychus urticae TaxID=32264 RepID=UPI00077BD64D|nr:cathepsin L1-like [Tetranychus urticae]